MLRTTDQHDPLDPATERRLVRSIDLMIMVLICVRYRFLYLNKSMLGYAAVFNLQADLDPVGTYFNWLSSIFYLGFLTVSPSPSKLDSSSG